MEKVPVVIVTGYLGAGKTSLLKNILKDASVKVAVVMNEFGEIGVDTKIIRGKNVKIKELLNGCVCCSLVGELDDAVQELIQTVRPDMIVIETTGVAEPDSMITTMEGMRNVKLDSVITVVDADAFLNFPRLGHTGRVQIEIADVIILNKVDLVDREELEPMQDALEELNPRAKVIGATYSNVNTKLLFGFNTERRKSDHVHSSLAHVDSFVYRSDRVHDKALFLKFASEIPREIYRAKGFVVLSDGAYVFNFVNGRYDLEKSREKDTELVFIGTGIKDVKEKVINVLEDCRL